MSAILEAAAQVLEASGLAGFTTSAVAERAGVSIGTLYQYFADKGSLLRALAEREMTATLASAARASALGREQLFVLSRSLMGTIRAAVLNRATLLPEPRLRDELVRLVLAYVAALSGP